MRKRRRTEAEGPVSDLEANIDQYTQPQADEDLPSTLSPEDPEHFCLLSMALKCWLRRSISIENVEMGQQFIEEYLRKLPAVRAKYILAFCYAYVNTIEYHISSTVLR